MLLLVYIYPAQHQKKERERGGRSSEREREGEEEGEKFLRACRLLLSPITKAADFSCNKAQARGLRHRRTTQFDYSV